MEQDNLTLGIYFLTIGASASYQEDLNLENAFWYSLHETKRTTRRNNDTIFLLTITILFFWSS